MRTGNFTSSEIYRLMGNAKKEGELSAPALTYVEECNMERRLGRPLEKDVSARTLSWGKIGEKYVMGLLPLEYSSISRETIGHADFDCWKGTPDSICCEPEFRTVADIKCPFTLKSFCQLVDGMMKNGLTGLQALDDGKKYYWQLVSNSVLTGCPYAELIIFAPYKWNLDHIRKLSQEPEFISDEYTWIYYAADNQLPWIPEGGHYESLNKFRFEVPKQDQDRLRANVEKASKLLVEPIKFEVEEL